MIYGVFVEIRWPSRTWKAFISVSVRREINFLSVLSIIVVLPQMILEAAHAFVRRWIRKRRYCKCLIFGNCHSSFLLLRPFVERLNYKIEMTLTRNTNIYFQGSLVKKQKCFYAYTKISLKWLTDGVKVGIWIYIFSIPNL